MATPHCPKHGSDTGQSMVESALLFLAVATTLVLMLTFIRSAVAGRVKAGADTFGHGLLHSGN